MHHVLLYGSFPICSCSFAYWILHRLHHELLQNTKMPTRFCHVYLFNRATSMLFHLSVSSSFLHLLSSFLCPLKFQLIWPWALWAFLLFHIIFFLIWLHMTTASLSCQLLHSSTFLLLYIFYAQLFIPDMKITNWIESCEVKTGERERERDLKGSWAVKWRRWWQGEGNLLEDKQKRETQMKMRVERYRKRREDKEKWGLFKEDGWIEATELQSAVKYSAYLLCPVSAAQCEMLSRSCERGTGSLAFCLCRFVPLRQLVVVFLFCDTLSIPEGEAQLLSGSSPLGGEGQRQTSSSLLKTRWLAQGHFGRVKGRFK